MNMPKVVIYSEGVVALSVCAEGTLTKEDVAAEVNRISPTGINSKWSVSSESFRSGEPNPRTCENDPTRKHWLLVC